MSKWGLLGGLGLGLSQGAQILNAGLADDRNARREAEREARREAIEAAREKAAESRWRESFEFQKQQAQEQRQFQNQRAAVEDQRYKDNKDYQLNRDKITDERNSNAEKRSAIDNEVKYILDDYNVMTRGINQQASEEIKAAQKEVELLMRAQKSADPMSFLAEEGVSIKPENIMNRLNALNRNISNIRKEQTTKLAELRAERDQGLATIKDYYGDAVSKSSYSATLARLGLPKTEAAEVAEFAFSDFAKGALDQNGVISQPTSKARDALGNKIPATTPITTSPAAPQEQQTRLQYGVDIAGKAVKGNAGLLADFLIPAAGAFADNVYKPAWDWLNSPMPPQQPQQPQQPKQNR